MNKDKFWVYSVIFAFSLLLHYFTPYYENQTAPNFVKSVIIAPLFEEFVYRFLGILIASYGITKITKSEPFYEKIFWGGVFIISMYIGIKLSFLRIEYYLLGDLALTTFVFSVIYLGVLLILKQFRLEMIIVVSSFNWALIHESFRVIPVFIAGIFFSILCINRSKITYLKNQDRKRIIFFLFYGTAICYLIHFWNNFLNYALYQHINAILIDLTSLAGVVCFLFILETFINPIINERCGITSL